MIGQPTETMDDIAAIPALAGRMLERLRVLDRAGRPFGRLTLSISSFVPKPWTPFQWAPFDGANRSRRSSRPSSGRPRLLERARAPRDPREAALQALLARGDRRVGVSRARGVARRRLAEGPPEWDGDPELYTTRRRSPERGLPWITSTSASRRPGSSANGARSGVNVEDTFQRRLRNLASRSPTAATSGAPTACRKRTTSGSARAYLEVRGSQRAGRRLHGSGRRQDPLTGGEPLLRRDVDGLIRLLAAKPRLRDLAITTNGVLLAEQARALKRPASSRHREPDTLRPIARRLTRRSTTRRFSRASARCRPPASPGRSSTRSSCAASTTTSWRT